MIAARSDASWRGLAGLDGINSWTWGALWRQGFITEPKNGKVVLTQKGRAKLKDLQHAI